MNSNAKFTGIGMVMKWVFFKKYLQATKVLHISNVTPQNEGIYTLEGRDSNGNLFYSEGKLTVSSE